MKRTGIHLAGLAFYAAAAWNFYKLFTTFNFWWMVPSLVLCFTGVFFTVWGLDDNLYKVTSGIVLQHRHADAYYQPLIIIPGANGASTIIPGHNVAESWSLLLRDARGHEGWVHFDRDVLGDHPVNSHYVGS